MKKDFFRTRPKISAIATVALALALIAAITAVVSGVGHRFSLWDFGFGFSVLRWGVYIAIGAAIVAVVAVVVTRPSSPIGGLPRAIVALLMALAVAALPAYQLYQARSLPKIHDISTDTENPPKFVAVLPLRAASPNSVEYAGAEIASQQRQAYPDITPLSFAVDGSQAFAAALASAKEMGWEIVAAEIEQGRIEATATTLWFGFKDDIVIRINAQQSGCIVDIRSVSRVGLSDVGANAARIRDFSQRLQRKLAK